MRDTSLPDACDREPIVVTTLGGEPLSAYAAFRTSAAAHLRTLISLPADMNARSNKGWANTGANSSLLRFETGMASLYWEGSKTSTHSLSVTTGTRQPLDHSQTTATSIALLRDCIHLLDRLVDEPPYPECVDGVDATLDDLLLLATIQSGRPIDMAQAATP